MSTLVIYNIAELVTNRPLAEEKRAVRIARSDLGIVQNAWLAIEQGQVKEVGAGPVPKIFSSWKQFDACHALVLPGLIDAHTHPIFAGSRAHEFAMKLDGKTYQEIAAEGGGIASTVKATRNASNMELLELTRARLTRFLSWGVTTVEAKSGYGLSVKEELRLLELLKELKDELPVTISVTCLALHALSPEHRSFKEYSDEIGRELLPEISRRKLAEWVDVFIEKGYFQVKDVDQFMEQAKSLGLGIRIHADEFSDAGAAAAAGRWNAASADHLECASEAGIAAMAKSGVTAILLPGTSLYSKIPYVSAKPFTNAGCPIALATDFNPGSCVIDNLPFIATVGAIHCGLSLAEAVAGVTYVPAYSLNLHSKKGALAPGFDADLVFSPLKSVEDWLSDIGRTPPKQVWIRGEPILIG